MDACLPPGSKVWNTPAQSLLGATGKCVSADRPHAGEYVKAALSSGRNDSDAIAPAVVKAAIMAVLETPQPARGGTTGQVKAEIGSIVSAAVKATPSQVLKIVSAAVKASSPDAASVIVTAAVQSVPNPAIRVSRRNAQLQDGKDAGKEVGEREVAPADAFEPFGPKTPGTPATGLAPGQPGLTLAEAIVQVALQSAPGIDPGSLNAAATLGLRGVVLNPVQPWSTGVVAVTPVEVLAPTVPILPTGTNVITPPRQSLVSP